MAVSYTHLPEWRNFFEASDKRRDVAICTYRYTWNGTKKEHVKEERSAGSWYVGKWRREWMPKESWNKNINYADVNYCPCLLYTSNNMHTTFRLSVFLLFMVQLFCSCTSDSLPEPDSTQPETDVYKRQPQ